MTSIDSSFKESEQIQETKANNAYFVCKSCNNYITIDEGTTVYSKNYGIITDHIDYTLRIHDPTLMYTKTISVLIKTVIHIKIQIQKKLYYKNRIQVR